MSRNFKVTGRGPFVLWPCALLALMLTAHATNVQGQPTVQQRRQEFRLPPAVHHVKGRVVKGQCDNSMSGKRLVLKEYWYVMTASHRLAYPNGRLITSRASRTGARVRRGAPE